MRQKTRLFIAYLDTALTLPLQRKKKIIAIGNGFKSRNMMGHNHLTRILTTVHELGPIIELGVISMNKPTDFPDYVYVKSLNKKDLLE